MVVIVTEDLVDGKTSNTADCSDDNYEDSFSYYRAEWYRLETFQHWPKQNIVSKEDLARHGFYYLKSDDRVKCAFCNVVLRDWAHGDKVEAEHERHSKRCPLVLQGLRGAQNIPYNRTPSSGEEPAYPQYADYTARLKTYEEYWPKSMKQRPRDLAAAGLFYIEKGDAVRCFQCAGLLRNWEPNDIPWEEHKRFFPRCSFLQQNVISPRRDPVHQELVRRQVSRDYDPVLVKKFEEYREAKKFPPIRGPDQYKEEIEQFLQMSQIQQNTEPPDPAAAANSLSSTTHHYGASGGLDEIDARTCVKCCVSSQDHHIMIPCNCTCCEKCVEHIVECPSCKQKIRAALNTSSEKRNPKEVSSNVKANTSTNAKRQLFGNSVPGLDEC